MSETFRVRLEKEQHVFSAAHFITFAGHVCERLHGHNYGVAVEVTGPLDDNHYVIDFIALRDALKTITDELDHHMLLPTQHPRIVVVANEREVDVRFEERHWLFPRGDCVLLPVPNTTAELLAKFIGQRLLEKLPAAAVAMIDRLRIDVDENHGQWGVWEFAPQNP